MISTLQELGNSERGIWLYDTFEGMTEPTERDVSDFERPALHVWREAEQRGERPWSEVFGSDVFNEGDVRQTVTSTGYPSERIILSINPFGLL